MREYRNDSILKFSAGLLTLLLVAGFLAPFPAQARLDYEFSDGGNGTEGDPLDSNDYGDNGAGSLGDGNEVEDSAGAGGRTAKIIRLPASWTGSFALVPEYRGGMLTFRFIRLPKLVVPVEARHAR